MPHLTVVDHPLVRRDLARLRDAKTPHGDFRRLLADVSTLLAYEALRDLSERETSVQTPLEVTVGFELAEPVIVVPVLRAGLGMVDGILRLVPDARVGHVGLYRDETTHLPVSYYLRLPSGLDAARVIVVDPMLATGGSAVETVARVREAGAKRVVVIGLVAAPEGIRRMRDAFPDIPVFVAALDRELDSNAYIRPGLGDAGDRVFGTDH